MKKLIIIGAGPAGLTAGYELSKNSGEYEVTILEESQSIGGISRTVKYNGNRMDIGGHRFFSKDERVTKWWDDMLPMQGKPAYDDKVLSRDKKLAMSGPDPEVTDEVMLLRHRVSRIFYKRKFFDYPVTLKWDTIKNMGFLTTMNAGFSYLASCVSKKDESSLENFYINRFGKKLYSMFFEGYTEKLWGRHPRDISSDWGSQRVKGLSIKAVLLDIIKKIVPVKNKKVETSLIEEFIYPKYGPGQLWEKTASEIEKNGGKIMKGCKAEKINIVDDKIVSVVYSDENGVENVIEGDIFISSMPLKDLTKGLNTEVPSEVMDIAQGLPYRDFVTFGVLTNKLKLTNKTNLKTLNNIVPDCWIYVQDTNVKLGRIQIFNNWSPYMVKNPDETVWIGLEYFCNENDDFWNMTDEEAFEFAKAEMLRMNLVDEENILDFHREKVKKAYPAYFDTYYQIDKLIEYINKFDNLFCIGRNGQHRYNNMDHSMVTAFEAVKAIYSGSSDKTAVWNVNTETEYHEEKKGNEANECQKA